MQCQVLVLAVDVLAAGLNGFKHAGISPVAMDISKKYTAIIVGVMNCGSNLTYYALANNIIGWWLDRGRCLSVASGVDLPKDIVTCRAAWTWLFIGSAGLLLTSSLLFLGVRCEPIDDELDGGIAVLASAAEATKINHS